MIEFNNIKELFKLQRRIQAACAGDFLTGGTTQDRGKVIIVPETSFIADKFKRNHRSAEAAIKSIRKSL